MPGYIIDLSAIFYLSSTYLILPLLPSFCFSLESLSYSVLPFSYDYPQYFNEPLLSSISKCSRMLLIPTDPDLAIVCLILNFSSVFISCRSSWQQSMKSKNFERNIEVVAANVICI